MREKENGGGGLNSKWILSNFQAYRKLRRGKVGKEIEREIERDREREKVRESERKRDRREKKLKDEDIKTKTRTKNIHLDQSINS